MILAIDGGLATLGWAVVEPGNGRVIDLGYIETEPNEDANGGKQRDRLIRLRLQSDHLAAIVKRHDIRVIAGEGLSFPFKGKANAIVSVCLCWGSLIGMAALWGCETHDVPPKTWQHAVLGIAKDKGKVNYAQVYALLETFLEATSPHACRALFAISKSNREHPADAVGVGVYTSMRLATGHLQSGAT